MSPIRLTLSFVRNGARIVYACVGGFESAGSPHVTRSSHGQKHQEHRNLNMALHRNLLSRLPSNGLASNFQYISYRFGELISERWFGNYVYRTQHLNLFSQSGVFESSAHNGRDIPPDLSYLPE